MSSQGNQGPIVRRYCCYLNIFDRGYLSFKAKWKIKQHLSAECKGFMLDLQRMNVAKVISGYYIQGILFQFTEALTLQMHECYWQYISDICLYEILSGTTAAWRLSHNQPKGLHSSNRKNVWILTRIYAVQLSGPVCSFPFSLQCLCPHFYFRLTHNNFGNGTNNKCFLVSLQHIHHVASLQPRKGILLNTKNLQLYWKRRQVLHRSAACELHIFKRHWKPQKL